MDHLPKLIASTCKDSESLKMLTTKIESSMAYSLILDETTDVSTSKSLAVVIRFFDENCIKDHFFGLLQMQNSSAEAIYEATLKHLRDNNIPLNKLTGLAADNANVMMGNITGVQARFKQIVPGIFVLGCVCHSFHLCASAAANTLPKSVEDFARSIYNFFSNSSNRCKLLTECQQFLHEKPHKMLRPSQTRWLSLEVNFELMNLGLLHSGYCFRQL